MALKFLLLPQIRSQRSYTIILAKTRKRCGRSIDKMRIDKMRIKKIEINKIDSVRKKSEKITR
tara:strand:+ start:242 stop:430 length:189 start_codon:yes stop_codon:yes gene_type:complete